MLANNAWILIRVVNNRSYCSTREGWKRVFYSFVIVFGIYCVGFDKLPLLEGIPCKVLSLGPGLMNVVFCLQ